MPKKKKSSPQPQKRSRSLSKSPSRESYIKFANRIRQRMILKYPHLSPLAITREIAREWRMYQYFMEMSLSELKVEGEKNGCYIADFL